MLAFWMIGCFTVDGASKLSTAELIKTVPLAFLISLDHVLVILSIEANPEERKNFVHQNSLAKNDLISFSPSIILKHCHFCS